MACNLYACSFHTIDQAASSKRNGITIAWPMNAHVWCYPGLGVPLYIWLTICEILSREIGTWNEFLQHSTMDSRIRRDPILVSRVCAVALCGTMFYLELHQVADATWARSHWLVDGLKKNDEENFQYQISVLAYQLGHEYFCDNFFFIFRLLLDINSNCIDEWVPPILRITLSTRRHITVFNHKLQFVGS